MIGRVYKITNADESIVYIGSTTQTLKQRWEMHAKDYKRWINDEGGACSIYHHFRDHGIDNFSIHLISEHEIENKRQLHEFEQLSIDTTSCVNKNRAFRSRDVDKLCQKHYRENNKDKIKEIGLRYYQNNIEEIKQKCHSYRELNRETIRAKASVKYECECGSEIRKDSKSRHEQSNKHIAWLESQS